MQNRRIVAASFTVGLALLCAVLPVAGKDSENFRPVELNTDALTYAKKLISEGHVVVDRKGAWADDLPSTELENEFIRLHGFSEYAKWHRGIDDRYPENTKRRYKFPYGDFKNVHRCGVLALQARAADDSYSEIAYAATQLRAMIEESRNRT